jgi:riboflavin synthase
MFTGIIKEVGQISCIHPFTGGREITIRCNLAQKLQVDQSICINGVCLTVVESNSSSCKVQSIKETLRKTNIDQLKEDDRVNLEPSLRADQPMDGHIVQGHVDTTGRIESISRDEDDRIFSIRFPKEFSGLIVPRGSITLNGISLTVAEVENDCFSVAIIPYTFHHTTMQYCEASGHVNLEFDILGKYVARYMKKRCL